MAKTLPKRSEVAPETTWDLSHIVKDDAAWLELYRQCEDTVPVFRRSTMKIPEF